MASITKKQVLAATVVYSIARGVADELRPRSEGSPAEQADDTEVFDKVMCAMRAREQTPESDKCKEGAQ